MQNKLKTICSIAAMAVFLVFAVASELFEESTNGRVLLPPGECDEKPPFTGKLKIIVTMVDTNGLPYTNANGELHIVHQDITDPLLCAFSVLLDQTIQFASDDQGKFIYETPEFTHDNEGDLWRVHAFANFPLEGFQSYYDQPRGLRIAHYNTTLIEYYFKKRRPL